MSEGDINPVSALLPWYLSGTLSADEMNLVRNELATSEPLRLELEDLIRMRRQLNDMFADESAEFGRIRREVAGRIGVPARSGRIATTLRRLFAAPWMPALAASLIVVQFAVLAGVWQAASIAPQSPDLRSRSLDQAAVKLKFRLRPEATAAATAALLQAERLRVVDGPDPSGIWTAEAVGAQPYELLAIEQKLRQRPDVVLEVIAAD